MKKILFLMILFFPIVLSSCSSDDDDWIDLNSEDIVGTWSTGIEGTHKYIKFESDGTGYYALLKLKGQKRVWECLFSKDILKIKDGSLENGTYKRLGYDE